MVCNWPLALFPKWQSHGSLEGGCKPFVLTGFYASVHRSTYCPVWSFYLLALHDGIQWGVHFPIWSVAGRSMQHSLSRMYSASASIPASQTCDSFGSVGLLCQQKVISTPRPLIISAKSLFPIRLHVHSFYGLGWDFIQHTTVTLIYQLKSGIDILPLCLNLFKGNILGWFWLKNIKVFFSNHIYKCVQITKRCKNWIYSLSRLSFQWDSGGSNDLHIACFAST